ncbi:RNA dependent RNA polymerase-domain-containing protein [Multifurca ochricompacta]|uniref:RNA-dependent RNA polymerase n=1 Tax=Multifurca ochricompacta TaxID=376703 RepID=A0AAD4MCS1_9AGAM|nr:RNA dependent RNA polymerase-domain-containing protein [Multifurca ochricompacta]
MASTSSKTSFGSPLNATFHNNGSVISLESSSSEGEDTHDNLETQKITTKDVREVKGIAVLKPQRRYDVDCDHQSQSHRSLLPLKLPDVFCSPALSRVATPRDDGQRVAIKSRKSDLVPKLESSYVDRIVPALPLDTQLPSPERPYQSSTIISPSNSNTTHSVLPSCLPSVDAANVASPPHTPFIDGRLPSSLNVICHCEGVQQSMEHLGVSWGVQYELARGVLAKKWTWADVTDSVLARLQGSNAKAAPRVHSVMSEAVGLRKTVHRTGSGVTNLTLWEEYDREQDAILERRSRGLGLKGEWKGVPDWYGGRIQQVVRLSRSDGTFSYRLDLATMHRSNRFARFLGSRRILQVKLSKDLRYAKNSSILEHLSRRFLLCGRVFMPFASKEGSMYMMEVNQDIDRSPDHSQGDDTRMSLVDFVGWHNPLLLNQNQVRVQLVWFSHVIILNCCLQPFNKWSTRFDLGLSASVPVLEFEPQNINFIPDIEATHEQEGKTPPEKILTDGCGFINGAALTLIARRLCLPSRPTAVQGRVAGSKGLWILHPKHRSAMEPPRIWIRNSQKKICLRTLGEDRAQLIFDLVAQSNNIIFPSRLNHQLTVNLSENGVDDRVFKELLHERLTEIFTSLTRWEGAAAMPLLWSTVNNLGGVARTRLQRVTGGLSRAIGLARRFEMDRENNEDDSEEEGSGFDADFRSLHQTVLELIQSGFNPRSSAYLHEEMRSLVKQAMDGYLKKYHLEVPQSAEAFIVPDPFGVLEEGQVHFRSSQELKDPLTETNVYSILGPVLVSRNPTMLASDIQKVEAIEHEQLVDYVNVVVFSTKGSRSLASLLAGGDYDGDTVMVNWNPSIVEQFQQPKVVDMPGGFQMNNFEEHVESVKSFCDRLSHSAPDKAPELFSREILNSSADSKVGKYSRFHQFAVYTMGYSDSNTVRLAYMFMTCLDSRKTGYRVQEKVFEQDSRRYGWGLPDCLRIDEERDVGSLNPPIRRREKLGPFVLDALQEYGQELADNYLRKYEELRRQPGVAAQFSAEDCHLLTPYKRVSELLTQLSGENANDFVEKSCRELGVVEEHVKAMKLEWPTACFTPKAPAKKKNQKPAQNSGVVALQQNLSWDSTCRAIVFRRRLGNSCLIRLFALQAREPKVCLRDGFW